MQEKWLMKVLRRLIARNGGSKETHIHYREMWGKQAQGEKEVSRKDIKRKGNRA